MSLDTNGMTAADVAAVVGNNRNNDGFGFGGDGAYLLLFLILCMGGWNGGGMWGMNGGAMNNGGVVPYLYNTQTQNEIARGFDQSATTNALNGLTTTVTNGFAGVNQGLCNSTASITQAVNNGFASAEIAANARQIADMQNTFNAQTALANQMNTLSMGLQNCCCENRANVADLKYTVATENCADRAALSDGIRDIIANQTANTQAILDKMCQQEIDALKTQNDNLRTQLNMANLTASQTAQTAQLIQDNNAQTATLINRIAPYPVPSFNVPSPYYYGINNGCGCGCNG